MFPDFLEKNDPSLKQGEKFNKIIKTFDAMVEPQLTIIEKGSPKVLEGFRENMGPGEAKLQGIQFSDHLTHMVIHSLLHLLGFKHEKLKDFKIMKKKEINVLSNLSISSPYTIND